MHSKFSEAFVKPISSTMPNTNNQVFQNSKDEVSFLHFLKINFSRNSVEILTYFILCNLQNSSNKNKQKTQTSYIKQESFNYKIAEIS